MAEIHLFLNGKGTTYNELLTRNGDVIIKNPIKAIVTIKRNDIWYLTVKFPKHVLRGARLTQESIFRVNLGFSDKQLFRMIYPKENKKEGTYECYCNHVFFDAKYEACPTDNHKCNNTNENKSYEKWTWEEAIKHLNAIGTGAPTQYHVIGETPEPLLFDSTPEPGELFKIVWKENNKKAWDVRGGSLSSGTAIQMYDVFSSSSQGCNPAQYFALTKSQSENEYNIRNYKSYLYANVDGGVIKDGAKLMIYKDSHDAPHERFTFEKLAKGGSKIHSAKDKKYVVSRGESNWNNNVQLCMRSENESETSTAYMYEYAYNRVDLDFNEQNLIESMFGTNEAKSMKKGFEKVIEKNHTTAMLNNYTCYFGDMNKYPEYLKPREIVIPSRNVKQDISTETSEERVDAIIPVGGNNKRPPASDKRSLIKSNEYDTHSVHHIVYRTYDEFKLKNDGGDIETEDALWEALAGKAKAELDSGTINVNKIKSEVSVVDIVKSGNPIFNGLKINDVLLYANDQGEKDKYYIDSYTYDVATERINNLKIFKEGENNG